MKKCSECNTDLELGMQSSENLNMCIPCYEWIEQEMEFTESDDAMHCPFCGDPTCGGWCG